MWIWTPVNTWRPEQLHIKSWLRSPGQASSRPAEGPNPQATEMMTHANATRVFLFASGFCFFLTHTWTHIYKCGETGSRLILVKKIKDEPNKLGNKLRNLTNTRRNLWSFLCWFIKINECGLKKIHYSLKTKQNPNIFYIKYIINTFRIFKNIVYSELSVVFERHLPVL